MIRYDSGDYHIGILLRLKGTLVPRAILFALVPTAFAFFLSWYVELEEIRGEDMGLAEDLAQSQIWTALNAGLTLCLAFRTSQALGRFWEGASLIHMMRAEWFDACSSLIAFSSGQMETRKSEVLDFWHTLVRLMSLMHGFALFEIKEMGGEVFPVIDAQGLDAETLRTLTDWKYDVPQAEICLHWLHELITKNVREGVIDIAPPIVSRVYQELSRGMVNLHNAKKISTTPFPFPYAHAITLMLVVHAIVTPFLVSAAVKNPFWASIVTFVPITGFWCINFIAAEIENPFGNDDNDFPLSEFQTGMNQSLLMLLDKRVQRTPQLSANAEKNIRKLRKDSRRMPKESILSCVSEASEDISSFIRQSWVSEDSDINSNPSPAHTRQTPPEDTPRQMSPAVSPPDAPGEYVVNLDLGVSSDSRGIFNDGPMLAKGTHVTVLEIYRREGGVHGRITQGYIPLVDTDTGERWANKVASGELSPFEAPKELSCEVSSKHEEPRAEAETVSINELLAKALAIKKSVNKFEPADFNKFEPADSPRSLSGTIAKFTFPKRDLRMQPRASDSLS